MLFYEKHKDLRPGKSIDTLKGLGTCLLPTFNKSYQRVGDGDLMPAHKTQKVFTPDAAVAAGRSVGRKKALVSPLDYRLRANLQNLANLIGRKRRRRPLMDSSPS